LASTSIITTAGLYSSAAITSTGNVYGLSFVSTSDLRLKDNIRSLQPRAKHVFDLSSVSFNYKRGLDGTIAIDGIPDVNNTYFGFIAQEVEVQFPELVTKSSEGVRSVHYSQFIPLLLEGIKTLRSEDLDQREVLETLSRKVETLEDIRNAKHFASSSSMHPSTRDSNYDDLELRKRVTELEIGYEGLKKEISEIKALVQQLHLQGPKGEARG